jgi:RyR domain/TrkA-N domain
LNTSVYYGVLSLATPALKAAQAVELFFQSWGSLLRPLCLLMALGLGFWGWAIVDPPTTWTKLGNDLFRSAQLLLFQFSSSTPGLDSGLPIQLNLARFLVPGIALFTSYRFILRTIRSPARLATLGFGRQHIVLVPGSGMAGRALITELRDSGMRAVAVMPDPQSTDAGIAEEHNLAVLGGDPLREATWHKARVDRASLIFVSSGTDVENLNIAVTIVDALRHRRRTSKPLIITAVENDGLAEQVDAALDSITQGSGLCYRRLSIPEEASSKIFLDPLLPTRKSDRRQRSHVILVGLGPGSRAVLRHSLTLGQDAATAGPCITVLATERDLAAEPLLWPDSVPNHVAELRKVPCNPLADLSRSVLDDVVSGVPAPVLGAVCLTDEEAVTAGLALARQAWLRCWPDFTVAVHQQREDRFLTLLARENQGGGHERLRPFGGLLPKGTLIRLVDGRGDILPRAVHEDYLMTLGYLKSSDGTPASWGELRENARHANRAFADHIAVKLAAIGCHIVPGIPQGFAFTDSEVEQLARIEHRRWGAERLLRGWRFGERDNERQLHPDLVPFDQLTNEAQQKNYAAVLGIPKILALAHLSIQRAAGGGICGSITAHSPSAVSLV